MLSQIDTKSCDSLPCVCRLCPRRTGTSTGRWSGTRGAVRRWCIWCASAAPRVSSTRTSWYVTSSGCVDTHVHADMGTYIRACVAAYARTDTYRHAHFTANARAEAVLMVCVVVSQLYVCVCVCCPAVAPQGCVNVAVDEILPADVHMKMVVPVLQYQTTPQQVVAMTYTHNMRAYIHIHTYIYIHIHAYTCIYIHTCTHTCIRTNIQPSKHTCILT
jgi:hypothetical protein